MSEKNIQFDTICADFEDINPSELEGRVSQMLGAQYLQQMQDSKTSKHVRGGVLGIGMRLLITLRVQRSEAITTLSGTSLPVNVHFLFVAASPQTYLSEKVLEAIGIEDPVVVGENMEDPESTRLPLFINGYKVSVLRSPSSSHFTHLNILGNDFVRISGAKALFGGSEPVFEIIFP
ncbi:hypothetical protein BGZ46_003907 [Entomortierella lignicola]|nr:hypothetical protein BGZ46_003907 [Entomortierella lignicola]